MPSKPKSKTRPTNPEDEPEAGKIEGTPFTTLPGLTSTRGPGNSSPPEFVSIGFGSFVAINRVLTVIAPDSAPVRRFLREARDQGLLVDATFGRKTKAVLLLDTGHVLTIALQPETIMGRLEQQRQKKA
ncbi:MAG: DUF370 domain-containing protein [Chloroflexota bacterium]|nr:DUF370 domain-containing protein [Chloroflexota bacterium]